MKIIKTWTWKKVPHIQNQILLLLKVSRFLIQKALTMDQSYRVKQSSTK